MNVFVLYRDMRPYGLREDLYREARTAGISFIRYNADKDLNVTNGDQGLKVSFSDRVLGRMMDIHPDLLVLASAVVPPAENPLAQLYKVPVNADGFFAEAHVKLRPVDFATDGVFVCGLAHAPKPIDESITQAQAAVSRAVTLLSKKAFLTSGIVAETNPSELQFLRRVCVCMSLLGAGFHRTGALYRKGADQSGTLQRLRSLRGILPIRCDPSQRF